MIWSPKHDEAINRTFAELRAAIKPAKSVMHAKEMLTGMEWPFGTQEPTEGPSGRVKRELANLAIVEQAKLLMEQSMDTVETT